MRHVLDSENGPDTDVDLVMVPIRTSILSRSGVEMRGLMGAEFMYHSLLRLVSVGR
jgi:hypothetical protein